MDSAGGDGSIELVDSTPSTLPPPMPVSGDRSCLGILGSAAPGTLSNGTYTIDPDEAGPLPPMQASCDMVGGGWMLVLDYVHRAQTTPALLVRTTDLPLLGSEALGTDESGTATWGHVGPQLLGQIPFSQILFQCRSGAHARVVDYATGSTDCVSYLATGLGACQYFDAPGEAQSDHTGMLPLQATHVLVDQGDLAATSDIFYKNTMPKANWFMGAAWACDEQSTGAGADTIHRVWVR